MPGEAQDVPLTGEVEGGQAVGELRQIERSPQTQ